MTEDALESPSLDIGRFVHVLRRRWLVVVLGLVVGCVVAVAVLMLVPRTATATTLVDVNVISAEPFSQSRPDSDLVDAETETQLARSTAVVEEVSKTLGEKLTPAQVRSRTTATLLADGTVLRISFSTTGVATAIRGADALAAEYLAFRSDVAQRKMDTMLGQLVARRTDLQEQLVKVRSGAATSGRAQAQAQVISGDLGAVASQMAKLQALDTTGGTVLATADPSTTRISPRAYSVLASGGFGGLLLGLVLAFVVNLLDRRVRDENDVEAAGGGLVLSRVHDRSGEVPAMGDDLDSIRSLRERLLAVLPVDGAVVAVADVNRHGLPTDIAVNLAIVTAQVGLRVNLVLPEHAPEVVRALRVRLGLSPTATGARVVSPRFEGVSVSVLGATDTDSGVSADEITDLLAGRDDEADLTVVALPPSCSRSLRLSAGRLGHAFVLVVSERDTRIEQVAALATELTAVQAVVHGSVLVPRERHLPLDPDRVTPPQRPARVAGHDPSPSPSPSP
ncbi:MAG: Wzz/FepE/Etk N-terminal domain-containing protein, partial [Nocardioidaceae bacterium]